MGKPDDFTERLEKLTPGLRRYARALTAGAAETADELVQETLQAANGETRAGAVRFRQAEDLHLELYAALTHLAHRRLRGAPPARPSLRQPAIVHGLADLPLEERETLLLIVLEGFGYDEAAKITSTERPIVLMRLMRARAQLTALDHRPSNDGPRRQPRHLRLVK